MNIKYSYNINGKLCDPGVLLNKDELDLLGAVFESVLIHGWIDISMWSKEDQEKISKMYTDLKSSMHTLDKLPEKIIRK